MHLQLLHKKLERKIIEGAVFVQVVHILLTTVVFLKDRIVLPVKVQGIRAELLAQAFIKSRSAFHPLTIYPKLVVTVKNKLISAQHFYKLAGAEVVLHN